MSCFARIAFMVKYFEILQLGGRRSTFPLWIFSQFRFHRFSTGQKTHSPSEFSTMKFSQILLILTAVAVDATNTRRLRRGVASDVNAKYIDLASEVNESAKNRVARRQLNADTISAHEERHMAELEPQSMSVELGSMSMMSMSMGTSLSMSLSMSM